MECDVCGAALAIDELVDDGRGRGACYACPGCDARVTLIEGQPPFRVPWRSIEERWAAATHTGPGADTEIEHGVASFNKTLCGLSVEADEVLRKHFWPFRDESCEACSVAAARMDHLWPVGVRGRPPG